MRLIMASTIDSTNLVRWDLSILYSDIEDPRLDSDLSDLAAMAKHFSVTYKGRLGEILGPAIKAKHAGFHRELSALRGEHLTFFELELVQLTEDTLKTWYEREPAVAKHRPWIEHIRVFKRHFLTEPVKSALTKRSPFDSSSWGEF